MDQPPKFTREVWHQLWRITKPFFFGDGKRRAWGLLTMLIALSLLVTAVSVAMSYVQRDFFDALAKSNQPAYYKALGWYLAAIAGAIPLAAFYRYTEERLALAWRDWLTRTLMKRFFYNRAYYHLRSSEEIDNPDQRISEDVRNFTVTTLSFLLILMNSTIQLASYSGVLWSISGTLMAVLLIYSLGGTLIAFLIGKRLIGLHYLQYEREADYRYGLVRVRDNAESIAFYRGERSEFRNLLSRLGALVGNMLVLIRWNRNLAFFSTGYNYVALLLPTVIVAPLFFQGKASFGQITQAGGAFATMLAAMSLIITQFERLSAFAAAVNRVGALWDHLDERDAEEDLDEPVVPQFEVIEEGHALELTKLTVTTPNGARVLLQDLSLELPASGSILIMGESGSGKTSLLRALAGLWGSGEGSIMRPPYRAMMFLPQRPYMIPGTLRAQLEYPGDGGNPSDEELQRVLELVNLPVLADRVDGDFDCEADWANMLSLGEQQRVSFARLLLRKPAIAFLDEATSALDEPNEENLYAHLRKQRFSYISVGHRSTLLKHHDRLLRIGKNGAWELTEAKAES